MEKTRIIDYLSKYYTFSKKYMPLITLGIFLVMVLCKLSTAVCLSVYFGLLLAHLICLAFCKRQIQKHLVKVIQESGVQNDIQKENN